MDRYRSTEMLDEFGYAEFYVPTVQLKFPQWLRTFGHNCKEAYSIVRRLGLPETSVKNKLPYYKDDTPPRVILPRKVAGVIEAQQSGALYKHVHIHGRDHKPDYLYKWAPGVTSCLGLNVFLYFLFAATKLRI